MPKYYQHFAVTGDANKEAWDSGLESTEGEKKKIIAILVNVSGYAGNFVIFGIEREKIGTIPDYLLDTEEVVAANTHPKSAKKISRVEIDHELPVGKKFMVGISCGGTEKNLRGSYEYEIV